jgi:3-oxoisoapionate decarboxylase
MTAKRLRVGIDNYGLFPLQLDPLQTMRWAKQRGAEGVHFSGLTSDHQAILDPSYLRELAAFARENGMYLEWGGAQHIPRDPSDWSRKDLFENNRRVAGQAAALGTRIVRSCSSGLMRWQTGSPPTETLLHEMVEALCAQKQMLRDNRVILAIETHFEFTSFELVRLFQRCDAAPGDWLGICFDTMNCLTMLEDPVLAAHRLLPWIVSTHFKDGAIELGLDGFTSFPVAMGLGVVDLRTILQLLHTLSPEVTLSVEGHGGCFRLPVFDADFLSRFPDLTAGELARLIELSQITAGKSPGCTMIERERWPELCEQRMAEDIIAAKTIASSFV